MHQNFTTMDEKKLLIQIAEMYYKDDKNQAEIARELGIHRTTISKLLKQSREQGYVNIIINYEAAAAYSVEKNIEELFNIKKAIVVPDSANNKYGELGRAFATYISSIIKDNMSIGFSWGKTLAETTRFLHKSQSKNINCLPLIGGPTGLLESSYHVNTITYEAAKSLGANSLFIDVPAIPSSVELKDNLLNTSYNKELIKKWDFIDIAVVGIGSILFKNDSLWKNFYTEKTINKLNSDFVVGDILSRFYNYKGEHIPSEIDDRIIGLTIKQLLNIETRIGIAESLDKVESIIGALRGKYINVLITNQSTADAILKKING